MEDCIIGDVYRHKKRGSVYRILYEGQMKIGDKWEPSVTYRDMEGRIWTREKEKFFDGRFDLIKKSL